MRSPTLASWRDTGFVILIGLVIWQLLSMAVGAHTLPPPLATAKHIFVLVMRPSFDRDLANTAAAYAVALAIGMTGGLALGVLFGGWRFIGQSFEPLMHLLVATPKVTLYPVILLLFGLGDAAKIAFGVLHGLPPVAIITAAAIGNLKPVYRKSARTLRLKPSEFAWRLLIPAVIPEVLGAFRICFAQALLGVLVGEMFASTNGIGHLLMASIGVDDNPTILAVVVLVFLFAGCGSAALLAVTARRKS
jgi:NitT/TauT family transport system permease protein